MITINERLTMLEVRSGRVVVSGDHHGSTLHTRKK